MNYFRVVPRKISGGDGGELTYHSEDKLRAGSIVKIPLGQATTTGVVTARLPQAPKFITKPAELILDNPLPPALLKTLVWLSGYYAVPLPLVINNALPPSLLTASRPRKPPAPEAISRPMASYKLSSAQRRALKQVQAADSTVILHGDTGSGKTLIYRELIKSTLKNGKSALVLVPEIGLTPQAVGDYGDLTEHIFVTHSGLPAGRRKQIWLNILQQKPPFIVIGPRSALMSPARNLGLIIIDEAHENSFKQDVSPRFQSQTVAAYLAGRHGAKLVLGTATPRLSDYHLASSRNLPIVTLPSYHSRKPRQLTLVDKTDRDKFTRNRYLSDPLIKQIEAALSGNEQSLIYLNRRGTATVGLCVNCGWVALCPRCHNQLSLHQDLSQLRCHVCGWHGPIPPACPDCGQPDIAYRGAGTKRLESEIKKLWPSANIARFDTDNLKGERLVDLYHDLHDGRVDIAIGTQVIARGLDLPKLRLVGVISADSELYLPDFSASERTFQLLYQVMGRAGRGGHGQVVIQAFQLAHPAIRQATSGDYRVFYDQESTHRRQHRYPPYRHLMSLICAYATRAKAQSAATDAVERLASEFGLRDVLGPAPAFYERRGRRFRWVVVAKASQRHRLLPAAQAFRQAGWQVDLDPINLLY